MAWRGIEGKPYTIIGFEHYCANVAARGQMATASFKPRFVVLHNTGIPQFKQWHKVSGPVRMRNLERYYRDVQKWSAGPHLFIADDFIWTFTPLWLRGTHAPSWNGMAWGVEMVGDYDSETLNSGVFSNTIGALAALHKLGGFDPRTLRVHKEDPLTDHYGCPGKNVKKDVVINTVAAFIERSPTLTVGALKRATLQRGDDSPEVAELQRMLGMNLTGGAVGKFGPLTETRLKEFQRANGLEDDGIAGPATLQVLEQRGGR